MNNNSLYGLVACGGKSSRMGYDKSLIDYLGKPQRYHVYELLQSFCKAVFISCNESQAASIPEEYRVMIDLPRYHDIGPIAALLTAFDKYPDRDFLVIGCDYPLLQQKDIVAFIRCLKGPVASSFYNNTEALYEPLLAWYPAAKSGILREMFEKKIYSLQYYFQAQNTIRFVPDNPSVMTSVDTGLQEKEVRNILARLRPY